MTPKRHDTGDVAATVAPPELTPATALRLSTVSIEGAFSAPLGIPDQLDPKTLTIVFEDIVSHRKLRVPYFDQVNKAKPNCWLQPGGCPLNSVRLSKGALIRLAMGTYLVYITARVGNRNMVLTYYTAKTSLGTHNRSQATPVTINEPQCTLALNPTIEMNMDHVL